jgi:hypothetical protein
MKKLIVDADDFGLTKGINQGILEAIENSIVQSVSVITNTFHFKEILKLAKNYPGVSVGIHFNLVTGEPLSPLNSIRSLITEEGQFLKAADFKKRYLRGKIKISEINLELEKQIKALISLGVKPTHFNFHQIKLFYPRILPSVIKIAKKWKINKMRSYNRCLITKQSKHIYYLAHPQRAFTNLYLKFLTFYLNKVGIKTPHHLIDFGTDLKGEATLDNWVYVLNNLPHGINEIRVHPGYIDEELSRFSSYLNQREKELQILTSPVLKEAIKENKIKLISFRDL